jgi:hypothetical protein
VPIRGGVRQRYFIVLVLVFLTASAGLRQPWAVPGLAALLMGQVFLTAFWLRTRAGRPLPNAVLGFLALSYFGLAYLLALVIGTPGSGRFWIVLGVGLAILAPVVVLARGLFRST